LLQNTLFKKLPLAGLYFLFLSTGTSIFNLSLIWNEISTTNSRWQKNRTKNSNQRNPIYFAFK